ncbi:MAG: hypothetical protein J6Z11_02515 [Candidatus Riflebacteria bacterium]|nr:hypothetical protein [Candidatus Riflebacteria bacterium]
MNYISQDEVVSISENIKNKINQCFSVNDNKNKATTDLIEYKDLFLAVNAYIFEQDNSKYCSLEFDIPVNRTIPNFSLTPDTSVMFKIISIIFGLGLAAYGYYDSRPGLLIVGAGFTIIVIVATIMGIMKKTKMMFPNKEFSKKYIVDGDNIVLVKNLFDDKLCDRLAKYETQLNCIFAKNNHLIMDCKEKKFLKGQLDNKLIEFTKKAIDCAIIFNEYDESIPLTNKQKMEEDTKIMADYFKRQCEAIKAQTY